MAAFQLRALSFRKPSLTPYVELITPLSPLSLLLTLDFTIEFIILYCALFLYLATKL